ncbi:hypothetical protein ACOSQ2_030497 [Xanthoceras sorbifolium]
MEFAFPSFPILFSFLVFAFMVLKIWKRSKTNDTTLNLPPGPWKLPVIGNLHQLVGYLRHHRLRDLAIEYGPFIHLQLGEVSTIVVSSPEFAIEVMKTHDAIFASRSYSFVNNIMTYNSSDIALSPYGDYWRQLRKIATLEVFSTKRVQSFRSIREEEVSNLINWIASKAGSMINISDTFYSLTNGITSRAAFGKKCKDGEKFLSLLEETNALPSGFNLAELFPSIEWLLLRITRIKSQVEKLHQEVDQIFENIINEHKKGKSEGNDDLVDVLLRVQEDGDNGFHLATNSIKAVLWDVFAAGSETSATTIDWAMSELIKNPKVMKKVQVEVREIFNRNGKVDETGINEMKYLKLVIKETLRLHPPLPFIIPRLCRERCEIKGFEIPIKTRIIVNAWAIGRDPKYWREPESFIPERFIDSSIDYRGTNFEFIPFGAGRRICPGITFGVSSVEVALAMLLYHFDWKLPNEMKHEDLDMTESSSSSVRRKEDLYVIPIPYHPASAV